MGNRHLASRRFDAQQRVKGAEGGDGSKGHV